ncbi:GDP-mannose mannosyl hydrolase [Pseudomonas deceptionensis]|uniref:Colanic acid biosynthesis protein WcaH n=1 Tax=Pseudomonas deceptionensis TaxID=882211 RepID=A0A0J6GFM7_PSEDM|nr:GDP-mannose mannosyl hydrolase [Pseudomonas deceptionensis]KMM80729.1 GDP-mannose mannosyl hydrolase [Pseudomonas deceptionensis]SEE91989.1 colanic acid biosynthesis protein WcaH [Pseudomonas deceptionensis]
MWLSNELFRSVVDSTPLISIDLVVQNSKGECLLGQRLNRPAQGNWFVPGGRILKNETLDAAFDRLTLEELGKASQRSHASFLGVYEHFYADSVFAAPGQGPDTHYVVLAYQLILGADDTLHPPHAQHDAYRWWSQAEMQTCEQVHANTRAYLDALR